MTIDHMKLPTELDREIDTLATHAAVFVGAGADTVEAELLALQTERKTALMADARNRGRTLAAIDAEALAWAKETRADRRKAVAVDLAGRRDTVEAHIVAMETALRAAVVPAVAVAKDEADIMTRVDQAHLLATRKVERALVELMVRTEYGAVHDPGDLVAALERVEGTDPIAASYLEAKAARVLSADIARGADPVEYRTRVATRDALQARLAAVRDARIPPDRRERFAKLRADLTTATGRALEMAAAERVEAGDRSDQALDALFKAGQPQRDEAKRVATTKRAEIDALTAQRQAAPAVA